MAKLWQKFIISDNINRVLTDGACCFQLRPPMKALAVEHVHAGYPGHVLPLPNPIQANRAYAFLRSHGCDSWRDPLSVGLDVVLPEQVQVCVAQHKVDAVVEQWVVHTFAQQHVFYYVLVALLEFELVQQDQGHTGSEEVEVFFGQGGCLLDVDLHFLKPPMLVLQQQDEVDVDEGQDEQSPGEAQPLNQVHFYEQWEVECSYQHCVHRNQLHYYFLLCNPILTQP